MTEFAAEIVSSGLSVDPAVVGTVDAADEDIGPVLPEPVGDPVVVTPEVVVGEPVGDPVVVSPSVDPGDGVVDAGPASHSSSTVAAPESTDLKQYSWLSGASCLNSPC